MKASDLRVGNWVSKHGECYQITSATIVSLERGESDVEPILLIEEWLLRFGFEWSIYHQAWHKQGFIFDLSEGFFGCFFMHKSRLNSDIIKPDILHVHTLQNLYHALTGEELTYGK